MFQNLDQQIVLFINKSCSNGLCDFFMPYITELAGGRFLFIAGLVMLVMKKSKYKLYGLSLMAGMTATYHIVSLLKTLFGRARPYVDIEGLNLLIKSGGYSFPSNHSATAFMAAVLFSRLFGKKFIFFLIASVIALSRVYLGVHYLSDVLAGSVIGTLIGLLIVKCIESVEA